MERKTKRRTIQETSKPDSFTPSEARAILFHVRVVPGGKKGWRVIEVIHQPQARFFDSKKSAINHAKKISREVHEGIIIHDRNGKVETIEAKQGTS